MKNKFFCIIASKNNQNTLEQSLKSILNANKNISVILVDDCSDEVVKYKNRRVRIIRNRQSLGLTKSLNLALKKIERKNCAYVVRMDADDISYPQRISKQLEFLEAHPEVVAVGAWAQAVEEHTLAPLYPIKHPCSYTDILKALPFNSTFVHPTMMFRTEVLLKERGYDESFPVAQDYELMYRLARKYQVANLPEILLDYRVSAKSISVSKRKQQLIARLRIQWRYFDWLNWRCYAGIIKTMILMIMPYNFIQAIKQRLLNRK